MASPTIPGSAQPLELIQPPADLEYGTPEWYLHHLAYEMDARSSLIMLYGDYFEGRHKLTFASSPFREAFGQMLTAISDNWIPLTINSSIERLKPQGFLFGDQEEGDKDAWRIWQENYLDADAPLAFTEAAKHGEASLLIWPDPEAKPKGIFGRLFSRRSDQAAIPRITVEHPSQMIVCRSAGDRRKRDAALKRWQEGDTEMATLYLPDSIHYFVLDDNGWKARREPGENKLGIVPVVPLVNQPQMIPARPPTALTSAPHLVGANAHVGLGRSDMADIISTVDQINKLLCDMMVASEVAAFRQRWATGLDVPENEDGTPIQPFSAAVDRLWVADEGTSFGEFAATDLSNYTNAIEKRVQSLAARTRTPPHYLLGSIVNASGDALKAAEAGLASKVEGQKKPFGEAIEEAMRIAFAFMGEDQKASDRSAEINWAPSETRSESEYIDALVKKLSIGVPKEQLWRDAGYSPQEIRRFKGMLLQEAIATGAFGVPQTTPPPEPPPTPPPAPEPAA